MLQDSEHPEESMMADRRWKFRLATAGIAAVVTATVLTAHAGADTTIGPSGMTVFPSTAGGQVSDRTAGTVMKVWSNGGVSIPVATTKSGGTLEIRARGESCGGAPVMAVKRGGVTLGTATVGSSWATYTVALGIATGSAPVTVEFTNDFRWWFCDRNLYLSGMTVRDGAPTTTVPTTPVPTTPVPTTPVPTTPPTTTPPTTTPPTTTPPTMTPPTTAPPTTTPPTTPGTGPDPTTGCPVNQFRARYFNNTSATGAPVAVQCENAPGGSFSGGPLNGVNADNFSVDYEGVIAFPQTTGYTVSATLGNVGARVWLDDALIIDKWSPQWGTTNVARQVAAGQHRVRAMYANVSGVAHFGLAMPRSAPSAPSNNGNYFAADSFWNQPVPAGAVADPRSAGWISSLDAASNGISVNSRDWSTTVYNAPAGTPTTEILVTNTNRRVTIPYLPSFRPTEDWDAHLAVIDDATGCLYEFQGFNAGRGSAISSAGYLAYAGSGGHAAGPTHSGGELSYLGGMITPQDVQSGIIDHALRYAMPGSSPNYVYPGTRSDGTVLGGVPQGTRLQLDPGLDLTRFGLTPFQLMVARALQVYGGFNSDSSSVFTLYARSPLDGSSYAQPIQPLPDSLIRHIRFLTPSISSTDVYLDHGDGAACNQQR